MRADVSATTAAATVLSVGLFELNSFTAVFDRAFTTVHQVKYCSRPF